MTVGAGMPASLSKQSASEYAMRTHIVGAPEWVFAEWKMEKVLARINAAFPATSLVNSWGLQRIQVKEIDQQSLTVTTRTLSGDQDSVYEPVMELAPNNISPPPAPFTRYYGQAHGNVSYRNGVIKVDETDYSNMAVGDFEYGRRVLFEQSLDTYNPGTTTKVGRQRLRHTFDDGVLIENPQQFNPGYKTYNGHGAMLPLTFGGIDDMKYVKVGSAPTLTLAHDGQVHTYGVPDGPVIAWTDAHPYAIELSFPVGTIGVPGGWDYAPIAPVIIRDNVADYAKIYCHYIDEPFTSAIPAMTHYHTTRLRVILMA